MRVSHTRWDGRSCSWISTTNYSWRAVMVIMHLFAQWVVEYLKRWWWWWWRRLTQSNKMRHRQHFNLANGGSQCNVHNVKVHNVCQFPVSKITLTPSSFLRTLIIRSDIINFILTWLMHRNGAGRPWWRRTWCAASVG